MKAKFLRITFCASFLVGVLSTFATTHPASAISATSYNPGNIISDADMRNYNSMNQSAIQNFLKSKNSCNDTNLSKVGNRVSYFSQSAPYSWHVANGHFVCMADENFNGKTAAQIIYQAAQDYHINPQVLIVMLQKEQGLVTDTYPHSIQYRSATGYGCPDASACETRYYGFENQVRNAAALFNSVLNGGWTNYAPGWRYIYYYPSASCGGSNVYVENLATAALYRYTPYQPNQAALNAGYGYGNNCSTYGNRNFFLYFNDWFGSDATSATTASTTGTALSSAKKTYIPEGDYQLLTTSGKALDVTSGSTANGANIQIYTKNSTPAQTFHIKRLSDGFYRISNPASGRSIDVTSGSVQDGANVWLYDNNDTCAQKWSAEMIDNGRFTFYNACSGHALDVKGGHTATNGANIQVAVANGTNAQKWRLVTLDEAPIKGGTYNFLTTGGFALDVHAYGTENGANLHTWYNYNNIAQKFKLARGTDGYYTITNPNANKVVDVSSASTADGANVQLWESNGTCAQKWGVSKLDKYYVFRNACSGNALDVTSGLVGKPDINIHSWTYNQTDAQKWNLVRRTN